MRCKHIDTYESDDTGVKVDYISIKQDEYFKEYIKYNWMFIPYSPSSKEICDGAFS